MIGPMSSGPFQIVFAGPFDVAPVERMRQAGKVTLLDPVDTPALMSAVQSCDALLARSHVQVTRGVLEHAPKLRVIGRAGVGLENIDLAVAKERGVTVVYTPCAATEAVADLTVGMIIALVRNLTVMDRLVRSSRFQEAREAALGCELHELTLGIVGMGRIGRALARRCSLGFGMKVIYNDIVDVGPLDFPAQAVEKRVLYQEADVVSVHVPLTDDTRQMIDAQALSCFKAGSLLINTARGAVVDCDALADALAGRRLAGAALDVFDPEPLPSAHPLLSAPNTVFTPHIGARTVGGQARMNAVVDDVIRVLRGEPSRYAAW